MAGDGNKLYNVVFVLGGPGAGKGTQCQKIKETFGYVHLSAGDLLRAERQKTGSKYGEEIEKHIKDGSIVPVEITCSLLRQAMEESQKDSFLIDGFPRNKNNLDGWNKAMSSVAVVRKVLFFNCPEDSTERISEENDPWFGVCVGRCLDRGKTSGRADDNMESLKKRIKTYNESTMNIIDHYRKLSLVAEISANQTEDEVFRDVKQVFDELAS